MQIRTVSINMNRHAQVYSTGFGLSRSHQMKNKGNTHETLSLLFKRDGVLPKMVMGVCKEKMLGPFRKKFQEAYCHIK